MSATKIEYCDITINPIVGCSKISEGCANCYAERMAWRLKCMGIKKYQDVVDRNGWTGKIGIDMSVFDNLPKIPKRIFIGSMGDLFHPNIKDSELNSVFLKMLWRDWHTYLLLTKRPARMFDFATIGTGWRAKMDHVWLGVTAENQQRADERLPILLKIPAFHYWVSAEPLLGPIDLGIDIGHGVGDLAIDRLSWVIAGPETGPGARACQPEWIEDIYAQTRSAGKSFFDKRKENWLAREFLMMKQES